MKMSLTSQGHRYYREMGAALRINVDFVLLGVSPLHLDEMAEAMKKIEKFMGGKIDFVQADPYKPRCFYCGVLNEKDANTCTQCGAAL